MNAGRLRIFLLWLSDVVCVTLVWAVVVSLYRILGSGIYEIADYWAAWPVPIVFTVINVFARLYHGHWNYPSMPLPPVEEFRRLIISAVMTHALVMAVLGFSRDIGVISRFVLIVSGLLVAMSAQLFRDGMRWLMKRLDCGRIPVLVVGDGSLSERVVSVLNGDPYYGMKVVRKFAESEVRDVVAVGQDLGVKHLFACCLDVRLLSAQFKDLSSWFTYVEYIPSAATFPVADARAIQIGGLGGLEMVNQRRMRLLALEKSVVDRVLALVIFVCATPLFLVMPVLIKLTSKGPVFYKAKRLGKMGRTIYVWKFRSMYADADKRLQSMLDADPALKAEFAKDFKLKDDPRVTPLGRFMRKTSIDELPQLFNVFSHDMALIGPRPIVEKEVEKYGKAYEIFSSVKPGITGLWQASGRNDCSYDERVALDVHYILNWSPWMDLWIVFRTAAAVLKMKGSY